MGEPRNLPSFKVSPFQRRSGIAISLVCDVLDWAPDAIYQVGCGSKAEEVAVFLDAWPEVHLFGFEPNGKNFDWIKKKYPQMQLQQVALGDTIGQVKMYEKHRHSDGSSLFPFGPEIQTKEFLVPMTTLDTLFPEGPETEHTLLWIDTEGYELQVLNGAKRFLEDVKVINVETTARPWNPEWASQKEVHEFLIGSGFKRQWSHTARISRAQVDVVYVRPELFRPEYCCCPCQVDGGCND